MNGFNDDGRDAGNECYRENFTQTYYLSILSQVGEKDLCSFVDHQVLPTIPDPLVESSRSGLIMVPTRDTVQNVTFFLGEALVSEVRVRIFDQMGYGICLGRALEKATAIAILDSLIQGGKLSRLVQAFVDLHGHQIDMNRETQRREVESTRVEMETY
jgi:alpha-D-ribose 1-methylphosphonate 5-triphosphate synthase subunit PhnG